MKKYKLTNKTRFCSFLLVLAILLSMGMILKKEIVQGDQIPSYYIVTVQNGDTLWDIAQRYNNGNYSDLRELVYKIEKQNNIFGDTITPNQTIKVPTV